MKEIVFGDVGFWSTRLFSPVGEFGSLLDSPRLSRQGLIGKGVRTKRRAKYKVWRQLTWLGLPSDARVVAHSDS